MEVAALSGGMKRKLSVACAFLGEPKSVLQTADFFISAIWSPKEFKVDV